MPPKKSKKAQEPEVPLSLEDQGKLLMSQIQELHHAEVAAASEARAAREATFKAMKKEIDCERALLKVAQAAAKAKEKHNTVHGKYLDERGRKMAEQESELNGRALYVNTLKETLERRLFNAQPRPKVVPQDGAPPSDFEQ